MTERLPRRSAALAALTCAALQLSAGPAIAAPGVAVSGSFFVDSWVIPPAANTVRATQGITPDGSLKVSIDINDDLSFSAKACISCHGIEIEHANLDFQPKLWFNMQVGRIAVPFGEYANRVDQSGHKTASAPLIFDMGRSAYADRSNFNGPVVMLPYVDTGVMLYGQFFLGSSAQVWYGAYGVGGLKGSGDVDWMSMRSVPYTDNNHTPAYGGRLALTLTTEPGGLFGDVSLGGSYTGGRFDKSGTYRYDAVGADLAIPIWKFTLRGEAALRRTRIDPTAPGYAYQVVDDYFDKRGFYAELEHPAGRYVNVVYRYDTLERLGVPLPGSSTAMTPSSSMARATVGLMVTPAASLFIKLSYEYWMPSDYAEFHSGHVGVGGAF
jgi:cytochrome c553